MTSAVVEAAHRPLHRKSNQQQSTLPSSCMDAQHVCCSASASVAPAPPTSSSVRAWLRKLRLHSDARRQQQRYDASEPTAATSTATSTNDDTHKCKHQSSFMQMMFHQPHELRAVENTSRDRNSHNHDRRQRQLLAAEPSNNQALGVQTQQRTQWVAAPVQLSSSFMGSRGVHGIVRVGGRCVPFTRTAHRRARTKRSRAPLASIAETHAVLLTAFGAGGGTSASMQAYRSRAYYQPQQPSSSRKDKDKLRVKR